MKNKVIFITYYIFFFRQKTNLFSSILSRNWFECGSGCSK